MRKKIFFLIFVISIGTIAVATAAPLASGDETQRGPSPDPDQLENYSAGHPNIEHGLLADDSKLAFSPEHGDGVETVQVVIEAAPGQAEKAAQAVSERGEIETTYENIVQARLPRSALEGLANQDAVNYIRTPRVAQPQADYASEGVETIGANFTRDRGQTGENATVAVIDLGFESAPYHDPIADNVVHTESFVEGEGIDGGRGDSYVHGDASAEIVADTAPDVELVLISAGTGTELLNAFEWIEENDEVEIDAVSMSLGLPGGATLDGTDIFSRTIADSVNAGTPWFVSSGNEASGKHWNGTFEDTDEDSFHEFDSGTDLTNDVSISDTGYIDAVLQWSDWPETDQDYALALFNYTDQGALNEPVAISDNTQDGTQAPFERIVWTPSGDAYNDGGEYALVIVEDDATGDADFDMFISGSQLEYSTAKRSVTIPATAEAITTVGATYWEDSTLESFSSRGPTIDGRMKPEIVAPDGVYSRAYSGQFYGTSAAAPHAAGVAAILLGENESIAAPGVNDRLIRTADDLGQQVPNNEIGNGLIDASLASPPQNPVSTSTDRITLSNQEHVTVDVSFSAEPEAGIVQTRLTDETGHNVTGQAETNTSATVTTVPVDASTLVEGNVSVEARAFDTTDYQNTERYTAESTVEKESSINLTLSPQATVSSTIQSNETDPGFVIERVESGSDTTIILTYVDNGEPVIAGVNTFSANELDGGDVTVAIEDTSGFPGDHTAHAVPEGVLSENYTSGDTLSTETADRVVTSDNATVFQGLIDFSAQQYLGNTTQLTVNSTALQPTGDEYRIVIHETVDGAVAGVIGSSGNLTGHADDVVVPLDSEIQETGEFVAMLSDQASDPIRNADAQDGFVTGNVSDNTTVEISDPESVTAAVAVSTEPARTQFSSAPLQGADGNIAAQVTADGQPVSGVNVSVEAKHGNGTLTAGTTPVETDLDGIAIFDDLEIEEPGNYTLAFSVDSTTSNVANNDTVETTEFEVESSPLATYADDDGVISTDGLRGGVEDWVAGGIDTGLLQEIVQAWVSGESVI